MTTDISAVNLLEIALQPNTCNCCNQLPLIQVRLDTEKCLLCQYAPCAMHHSIISGRKICDDCFKRCAVPCLHCEQQTIPALAGARYGNGYLCGDCAETHFKCPDCDDIEPKSTSRFINDDIRVCYSCADDYCACECCGYELNTRDAYNNNNNGSTLCESCYEAEQEAEAEERENEKLDLYDHAQNLIDSGSDAIADYHPQVEWEFYPHQRQPLFGIELEVEHNSETARSRSIKSLARALKGHILCSYDGSLSNFGYEIITSPHSKETFRKLNWFEVLKKLSADGALSHDAESSCGLHIHIERAAFLTKKQSLKSGASHYKKLFDTLQSFLTRFSKRTSEQIEQYCAFQHSGRYSAVNLENDATVEIRLFRGTLIYSRFMASIHLTFALLQFMHEHSLTFLRHATNQRVEREFKEWLTRKDEYQFLNRYLNKEK